jgi:DNA-binding NarL/FixJ family response regulator
MVVRVLIVDDYQSWLRFIPTILHQMPELQVIAEASDGLEAFKKAIQLQPDLILLDIGLPILNGIEAARQIREHNRQAKILFLSEQCSEDVVRDALSTGSGYVVKSSAAGDLLQAVKAVLSGERFVSAIVPNLNEEHDQQPLMAGNRRHEFYNGDGAILEVFAQFVTTTLEKGDAVIVLATDSHRAGILQKLRDAGVDVCAAIDEQRYIPLDVADSEPKFRFAEYLTAQAVTTARKQRRRVGVA